MKVALIFVYTGAFGPVPVETSPTVIAVASTSPVPLKSVLDAYLLANPAMVNIAQPGGLPLAVLEVRVEDFVVPGDTITKSDDVWHKAA